ncbi:hypothetical protein CEXT_395991 [Caerostris extrusa]|uniref:Uncharacterized protein n=1 Tax=Caerostris extrusa TaxID=172846 RepID=A0AAV4VN11_CAEEX|nr:hypothetical protein CEXT_395991 [Caerostris extrusa]
MSSVDLSAGVLWHTLSKDVYTQSRGEKGCPPDVISEIRESLMESQPLLDLRSDEKKIKTKPRQVVGPELSWFAHAKMKKSYIYQIKFLQTN